MLKKARKKSLEKRLEAYPYLKERIDSIIKVVENSDGSIEKADEAEQRAIEELRQMGNDILHGWAENQSSKKEKEVKEKNRDANKHSKKNSIGTQHSE